MTRHAMTIACFVAAAVFYAIGFGAGVASAVAAGCVSEIIFWVRVSRRITVADAEKIVAK